ncbi:MAG TPA: hypothetical protein VKQ72_03790 [Aggregatilineales bacterium]|nr:hypothetical protein [Aggregatilineales bacterium]
MGRLLTVHPCPVCNYYVEGQLHEGGSGIATLFLRNRYALAICEDCHHLVSVLVPNSDQEVEEALKTARHDIVQMEADAVIGDRRAKELLPLFREALDTYDGSVPAATPTCTVCGKEHLQLLNVRVSQYDDQDAWFSCPRCGEGRLLVETSGTWD